MKVISFCFCENSRFDEILKKNILVNPLSGIMLPGFPSYFSFAINFSLCNLSENDDEIIVEIYGSDSIEMQRTTVSYPEIKNYDHALETLGINTTINFQNVLMEGEGECRVVLRNEDCILGEYSIPVQKLQNNNPVNLKRGKSISERFN